jgi:hypothetical protein
MRRVGLALSILFFLGAADFRLVSDADHQRFLKLIPDNLPVKKKKLVFYTEREMPAAYQIWDGMASGIHDPNYNISADKPREQFGNPNLEFPWGTTAGLETSDNAAAVKFVVFPENGKPIVWWREQLPHDTDPRGTFRWAYPDGTIFGEVLTVRSPSGYDYTFEVRTRTKHDGRWSVDLFRPFASPAELTARIKELEPGWRDQEQVATFVSEMRRPRLGRVRIRDRHQRVVIDRTVVEHELPPLPEKLVARLLTETPFKSVLGQEWVRDGADEGHAPTTQASFHIVPREYGGSFLAVSSKKCMTCHETTSMHADDFQFARDWYGRVRGDDHIFSFHIFEPRCISGNGIGMQPELRQALIDAGRLKQYDPRDDG